jgi:hypothetical protein
MAVLFIWINCGRGRSDVIVKSTESMELLLLAWERWVSGVTASVASALEFVQINCVNNV